MHGVLLRWQEVEPTLGWFLLDALKLDFMVMHTSEIRWYVPGTYGYDEPVGTLHNRMAFPPALAQDWMIEFLRADRPLALDVLLWRAYLYS